MCKHEKIELLEDGVEISVRTVEQINGQRFDSPGTGVFLFVPFLAQLNINKVLQDAGLPGTKVIPATSYLLSFLALKLLGTERYP